MDQVTIFGWYERATDGSGEQRLELIFDREDERAFVFNVHKGQTLNLAFHYDVHEPVTSEEGARELAKKIEEQIDALNAERDEALRALDD